MDDAPLLFSFEEQRGTTGTTGLSVCLPGLLCAFSGLLRSIGVGFEHTHVRACSWDFFSSRRSRLPSETAGVVRQIFLFWCIEEKNTLPAHGHACMHASSLQGTHRPSTVKGGSSSGKGAATVVAVRAAAHLAYNSRNCQQKSKLAWHCDDGTNT